MSLFGCWFSHGDRIRQRDDRGRLHLVCVDCGDALPLLTSDVVYDGPHHQQAIDLGACRTEAKRVPRDNVREWRRSDR